MPLFIFRFQDEGDVIRQDLQDREAARRFAIDLASSRLRDLNREGRPLVVNMTIESAQGDALDHLHSVAEEEH